MNGFDIHGYQLTRFRGKVFACFGDSIWAGEGAIATAPNSDRYHVLYSKYASGLMPPMRVLHDSYPDVTVYNYSHGGSLLAQRGDDAEADKYGNQYQNTVKNFVIQYVADIEAGRAEAPDYIILEGGANDVIQGLSIPLGELQTGFGGVADTNFHYEPDVTTTIGGCEDLFQYIMKQFRNVKIGFVLPPLMIYQGYVDTKRIYDGIVSACNKWSIPVFNTLTECGRAVSIACEDGTVDGYVVPIHPVPTFNIDIWYPKIEAWLNTL